MSHLVHSADIHQEYYCYIIEVSYILVAVTVAKMRYLRVSGFGKWKLMAVLLLSFVSLFFYSAWLWSPFINQGWQVSFYLLKVHFLLGLTVISIYKSGKHFTTLWEESVDGKNFCGFGSFWKIGKSLLHQKLRSILVLVLVLLNRKSFFQQNVLVLLNH